MGMASLRLTRGWLNRRYQALDEREREQAWARYAKLFRRGHLPVQSGAWKVMFGGRALQVPLRQASMWLDWDIAMSLVGHDLEVKLAYLRALEGPHPPELFIDVGSNYGTHALLMASQGIAVLAFEPIGACLAYGGELAAANGLDWRREPVALGERSGMLKIAYPPRDTWLATAEEVSAERGDLIEEEVPIRRLDEYAEATAGKRVLLKIDVEGLEAAVLRGGQRLLADGPTIIFESRAGEPRAELWALLTERGCVIAGLSLAGERTLGFDEFAAAAETNFIAHPPVRE